MKIDWRPIIIAVLAVGLLILAGMCIGVGFNLVNGGEKEVIEYSYISPQKVYKYTYKDEVLTKQEILYATKTVNNKDGSQTYYLNDGAKIIRSNRYMEVIYPDKSQTESYWNTDIDEETYSPSLDSVWKSMFE